MSKIDEILTRGVEQVLPSKKALASLMEREKITLYQGFDPTTKHLHIGHFIGIRKLAQFQKLGHKVIFLIGDFTAMVGDPTDKSATRAHLTKKQVQTNFESYKKQVSNIISFEGSNPAEVKYNSDWLSKLTFKEVLDLSANFTAQQMIERSMFRERIKKEKPVYLHEFLYPLMQGYDSVVMGVDLEVGGNDQLFNMLAGRTLMKAIKNKEKYVLTMKLLTDQSGKKMGKTEGNTINLTDSAEDIYGKIMALPDTILNNAIELLTDLSLDFVKEKEPMEIKKELAAEVIKQVHGEKKTLKAQEHFEKTFQKKDPAYKTLSPLRETLAKTAALASGASVAQMKRVIAQGGIDVNGKTIKNPAHKLSGGEKLKIGKKIFVKVKKP